MKTTFIGCGDLVPAEIGERLKNAIQNEIAAGCQNFIMDRQGLFVRVAWLACQDLHRTNPAMQIEVVMDDRRKIIDACDTVICYAHSAVPGAYLAMQYALWQGKKVVNLYRAHDDVWGKANHGSLFMQKVFDEGGGVG